MSLRPDAPFLLLFYGYEIEDWRNEKNIPWNLENSDGIEYFITHAGSIKECQLMWVRYPDKSTHSFVNRYFVAIKKSITAQENDLIGEIRIPLQTEWWWGKVLEQVANTLYLIFKPPCWMHAYYDERP